MVFNTADANSFRRRLAGGLYRARIDERSFYQISYQVLLGAGVKLLFNGISRFQSERRGCALTPPVTNGVRDIVHVLPGNGH
jgi:hypothetical protein